MKLNKKKTRRATNDIHIRKVKEKEEKKEKK